MPLTGCLIQLLTLLEEGSTVFRSWTHRQRRWWLAEWTGQTGTGEGGRVDRSERDRGGGHGGEE